MRKNGKLAALLSPLFHAANISNIVFKGSRPLGYFLHGPSFSAEGAVLISTVVSKIDNNNIFVIKYSFFLFVHYFLYRYKWSEAIVF